MNQIINKRLVGTIVVVLAGIILLPSILDGEKAITKREFKQIPKQPEFDSVTPAPEFPEATFKDKLPEATQPISDVSAVDETPQTTQETTFENVSDEVQVAKLAQLNDFTTSETVHAQNPRQPVDADALPTSQDSQHTAFESEAWIIQLGAFRNKANVAALVKQLRSAGYVVVTKEIRVKTGLLTKVYIGPEFDKKLLEKALPELKKLTKLSGKISKYEPLKLG